ncbi:thiol-activated cytolysin family protein [Aquimarina rubra]|uniref:Thiol-activated cytolysin family protein n=1 Tax=Aquimarina rubra TaxID=1920033 RepID=A0ABW5LI90_9FLAO
MKTIEKKDPKGKQGEKTGKRKTAARKTRPKVKTTTGRSGRSPQKPQKEAVTKKPVKDIIKKRPQQTQLKDKTIAKFKRDNTEVKYVVQKSNKKRAAQAKTTTSNLPETKEEVINDLICTTKYVEESVENADQYILSPLSSIWLGAAMNLDDLNRGVYSNNTEDRRPITISNSFGYAGENYKTIQNPSKHKVHQATVSLKNQEIVQNPGTQMQFDLFEVNSSEQLKLHFGAEAQIGSVNIAGASDFNFTTTNKNYMAVFKQVFYTESVSPIDKSKFFKDRSANDKDIYVSSIAWGRLVLLTIESSSSEQEISAMLNATFGERVSAEFQAEYEKTVSESNIQLYILGGGSQSAGTLISDLSQLTSYISDNSEYHPLNNPGSPIIYQFTSAGSGALTSVLSSTSYPLQVCVPYTGKYEVEIQNIEVVKKNKNKNLNVYGKVTVKAYTKMKNKTSGSYSNPPGGATAWNEGKKEAVKLGEGEKERIKSKKVLTFDKLTEIDDKASYIEIKGDLSEKEALKSDHLGVKTKKIYIYDLPNYASSAGSINDDNYLEFRDGKGIIRVNFGIKSLNSY